MTLTFAVADPCSTNRAYGRAGRKDNAAGAFGGGRGLYLTKDGRRFKDALRGAALAARLGSGWPSDPWRVAQARVSYQLANYRGDVDGPRKLIRDAFETVLYANDRVVEDGPAPLAIRDAGGRRVIILVELLALRDADEAQALRIAAERRAESQFIARYRAGNLPASLFNRVTAGSCPRKD